MLIIECIIWLVEFNVASLKIASINITKCEINITTIPM